MKKILLYILITPFLALIYSCGGIEMDTLASSKQTEEIELSVQIQLSETVGSRGAESATAIGIVPELTGNLLILLVKEDGTIDDIAVADAFQVLAPAAGVKLKFNRSQVKYVYVVGNVEDHKLDVSSISIGDYADAYTLKAALSGKKIGDLQYIIANQGTNTNRLDPYKVNVTGCAYTGNLAQGMSHIVIPVCPAIARIEIGELKSTDGTTFKLEEIFIDNNFHKMGVDYVTYPAATNDFLAVNWNNSGFDDGSYSPEFWYKLPSAAIASTSVKPSNGYWSFYVSPAQKENTNPATLADIPYLGNWIVPHPNNDSDPILFSAIPLILFKISDITPSTGNKDKFLKSWLTVRKFLKKEDGTPIPYLEPGKVYQIEQVIFELKNIGPEPISEPCGVDVIVKVQEWSEPSGLDSPNFPGPIGF
ncbi:hypothetical protein [Bacteroides sp. 224]|uniref:hypothetical protein n=1 Tax=Bacteroides sp. 224 TaxID=2302936 RepID=UPI0013D88894|nr:hypothetical protein [Bacteroides sp. 224]NDV65248.1 hypothetical protein [Bacteroides sp. 224]